jgi:hypothetical protein
MHRRRYTHFDPRKQNRRSWALVNCGELKQFIGNQLSQFGHPLKFAAAAGSKVAKNDAYVGPRSGTKAKVPCGWARLCGGQWHDLPPDGPVGGCPLQGFCQSAARPEHPSAAVPAAQAVVTTLKNL